jgi:signal transduction histidine kinase
VRLVEPPFAGPLALDADPRALRQILLNLMSNALKATPRGGCVSVAAALQDGALTVAVRDTGPGIGREGLDRIGRPYARAQAEAPGQGLGLWIARRLAEAQGGALLIDSRPGEGTTIRLQLPARSADPPRG